MTNGPHRPEPEILPPGDDDAGASARPRLKTQPGGDGASDLLHHPMTWPRVTYGLYAIALLTAIPMLLGLIVAYVARPEAPAWQQSHYTFLIRTFWYGLVLTGFALLTVWLGVGLFLLWVLPLWYVVRIGRGLYLLENKKPVAFPTNWLFG